MAEEVKSELASLLLKTQFPKWSDLAVKLLESSGTANTLFRLGETMVMRFPRSKGAAQAIEKEWQWLPQLASHVSLAIPTPLEKAQAQLEYPYPWAIYGWLEGKDLWSQPIDNLNQVALDLGTFIREFQDIELDGPSPGQHNSYRGVPLSERDSLVREAIVELGDRVDTRQVTKEWERVLEQKLWEESRWIHGDLIPGNLLAQAGTLTAIIDFGLLGVGDPAVELLPAWNLLDKESRRVFRECLQVDEPTWVRGRGWALYQALLALPYYWDSNPAMVNMSQRVISELFMD